MSLLYLIRHPHTRPEPTVPPSRWGLSSAGEEQVRALVLAPFWASVAALYTSPQLKTRLVGEAIQAMYDLPVRVVAGLDEASRDVWLAPEEFEAAQRAFLADPDRAPVAGWEAADAARRRFAAAIDRLSAAHAPHESFAVVTHATVLTLYLAHLHGEPARFEDWRQIGFAEVIALDRATLRPLSEFVAAPYDGLPRS
ncbi:MAG: phosphoglycerate mutase family protein [Anaerolineae bacterium]|nr:phosphoglycerate mutase family protein [Anaerolineae bacterium]